jgi:alpha-beta hydrolase superfamily lysophospholipase
MPTTTHPSCRTRFAKLGLLLGLSLILLWLLGSGAFAYRFTHRLHAAFPEPPPTVAWGKIESHRLTTTDGEDIGAWYIDGHADQPAVLLVHGFGGCRGDCLNRAEFLAKAGHPVLLISLRAHGDSSGDYNDIGFSARRDVIAAVSWLEKRRPGGKILLFGHSQGAAATMFAAGELGHRVQGHIWESPYRDLYTAVGNRTELYLPPVASTLAYAGLWLTAPVVMPDADQISPLDACAALPHDIPVLILAGGRDRRARPEEAAAIYEQIQAQSALEVFADSDHAQLMKNEPVRYQQLVLVFARTVARPGL